MKPRAALLLLGGIACGAHAAAPFDPANQPIGWIAPFAVSDTNLENGQTTVFRPWFTSASWQGDLLAYHINSHGALGDTQDANGAPVPHWSASARFQENESNSTTYWSGGRQIISAIGGAGVPFTWSQFSSHHELLDANATTAEEILRYVRGDRDLETGHGGGLRARTGLLGDIIHSTPVYVGAPNGNYTVHNYGQYRQNNRSRAGRVYVGANDGMVHTFDAATGDEVFAYIPSMLLSKLKRLTATNYTHTYFADGELASGDAYINGAWKTVLAGGLAAGGKGLFALDVSDPAAASETSAANKLLWEIDGADDDDLGYTYGRPAIARLNDGNWYAISGNGYNSANGQAVLYLVNLATGAATKLRAGSASTSNPNGLSGPALVDADGDLDIDYVYAGDIDGHVWKFNLTRASPANWSLDYQLYDTSRAITTAPEVTRHPNGGYLVYSGTGRLLTSTDASDTTRQYIYGLWDNGASRNGASLLTRTQTEQTADELTVRTDDAANGPAWTGNSPQAGWRIRLEDGERVITPPRLRAKRVQLVTHNPAITGGKGWLVSADFLTGGAPPAPVFDLNQDGVLDVSDRVDANGDGDVTDLVDAPVALELGGGTISAPALARYSAKRDAMYVNTLAASASAPCEGDCPDGFAGGHIGVDTDSPQGGANTRPNNMSRTLVCAMDPTGTPRASSEDGVSGCTDGHFPPNKDGTFNWNNDLTSDYRGYDKETGRTYVDLFGLLPNSLPAALRNTGNAVTDVYDPATGVALGGGKSFIILVTNADLSPGARITLGTREVDITDYQNQVVNGLATPNSMPQYTLDSLRANGGTLRISFDDDTAILQGGIHATHSGCVRSYRNPNTGLRFAESNAGVFHTGDTHTNASLGNRWRNGALTLQLIDASVLTNVSSHIQSSSQAGARTKIPPPAASPAESGLLYEITVYWDYGFRGPGGLPLCYGAAGWNEAVALQRALATRDVEQTRLTLMQNAGASAADIALQQTKAHQAQILLDAARLALENAIGSSYTTGSTSGEIDANNDGIIGGGMVFSTHLAPHQIFNLSGLPPGPGFSSGRASWAILSPP